MAAITQFAVIGRCVFRIGANMSLSRHLQHNAKSITGCLKMQSCGSAAQVRYYSAKTYFTKKHEYVVMESDSVGRIGISEYAQEKLGDIVYVQLPEVGKKVEQDDEVGAVESVKAASEIYSPLSGEIAEVNEALESDCSLVNKSPLQDGWIFKLSLSRQEELKSLLTQEAYEKFLKEEEEADN